MPGFSVRRGRIFGFVGVLVFAAIGTTLATEVPPEVPIPYPGAGLDQLHLLERAWTQNTPSHAALVDWEGTHAGTDTSQVAVRLHRDIGALEAVITAENANHEQEPLANAGLRLHAVSFDPPVALAAGGTLARVVPGPLPWSNMSMEGPALGPGTTAWIWTAVPPPGPSGTSPPVDYQPSGDPDDGALVWIAVGVHLAAYPTADDAVATRSPSVVRLAIVVAMDARAYATPAPGGSNVTITLHHDFGSIARGVGGPESHPVRATGTALAVGPVYTVARVLHPTLSVVRPLEFAAGTIQTAVSFDVPRGGRLPSAVPTGLFSPITLNATQPMEQAGGNTSWRLLTGYGPLVPAGTGQIAIVQAELGFMANHTFGHVGAPATPGGPEHQGESGAVPGPPVLALLLVMIIAATRHRFRP